MRGRAAVGEGCGLFATVSVGLQRQVLAPLLSRPAEKGANTVARKTIPIGELDEGLEDEKPKAARQVLVFSMSEPFWWAMTSLGR